MGSILETLRPHRIMRLDERTCSRVNHDQIDQMQVDSAAEIVTLRTRLVDRYPNPKCAEDTVGDVIRGPAVRVVV